MRIEREWLGGAEIIDLSTDEGWDYFVTSVVQCEEAAEELRDRIAEETEVIVNDNEPQFIERFTSFERVAS